VRAPWVLFRVFLRQTPPTCRWAPFASIGVLLMIRDRWGIGSPTLFRPLLVLIFEAPRCFMLFGQFPAVFHQAFFLLSSLKPPHKKFAPRERRRFPVWTRGLSQFLASFEPYDALLFASLVSCTPPTRLL